MPPQIPTFLKVGERLRLVKRSGINDIFDLLRRVAVSRIKFAVPIVAYMCNKRYRRRQFDNADSEFGDLVKPNIKEIHCPKAVDFSLSKNRLLKQYNEMYRQHCLKQFPYRQGINNFVSVSVQLH